MEAPNPYAAPTADINAGTSSNLPLATPGARFGARFLDNLVMAGPALLGGILTAVISSAGEPNAAPLALGYVGSFGLWVWNVVRLVKTGQSFGKKWMGVKVVDRQGGLLTLGGHFLRGLIFAVVGIIDVVFIFRADRRCLHDMAADSRVIAVTK